MKGHPLHTPVLLEEALNYLKIERPGIYIDGTIGLGGHSLEILRRNPQAQVIGLDLDETSLLIARERLKEFGPRIKLIQADFRSLPALGIDFNQVCGLLLDLGLSSFQLDNPNRGFSFNLEGPLDMRFDHRIKMTAAKIIEKYSENQLAAIFANYGELKQARLLAREIVTRRKNQPIRTTTQLRRLVEEICRWRPQPGKTHPAAKVFQALRIEVNGELRELDQFLEKIVYLLPVGARIVVISFHSLEDRIVKHTLAKLAHSNQDKPKIRLLTRKPATPSEEEVKRNPRSHSAKLRAAEVI
ncbi:MAG: 16S rRNA (cytosine(1402)-N(4))-methyltransferase RsmH [Candidatus Aminicenantes bacterium]|nr:16S rRNA (cytosine(1402)-N(4))-methyltransferase RsmH [Candidatus Aminicenantes bacterium]